MRSCWHLLALRLGQLVVCLLVSAKQESPGRDSSSARCFRRHSLLVGLIFFQPRILRPSVGEFKRYALGAGTR